MSEATWTCERCGNQHKESEKKEVFVTEGGREVKKTVCPKCLDEILNDADQAVGVEGDEKRAGVAVGEAAESTDRETYGERGEDSTGEGPRS
jgi:RNase P subunit RPR2